MANGKKWCCISCQTKFYDLGSLFAVCPKCGTDQTKGSRVTNRSNLSEPKPKKRTDPEINSRMNTERVIQIICGDERTTGNFIQTMHTFLTGRVVFPFASSWRNIQIKKEGDRRGGAKKHLNLSTVDYTKLLDQYIRPKIDKQIMNTREEKDEAQRKLDNLYWGHLIIDEGQDFPKDLYSFLYDVMDLFMNNDLRRREMSITVFADEHQRLEQSSNSTIEEIEAALEIPKVHTYKLEHNYRNTKQIYDFALEVSAEITPDKCTITNRKKGDLPKIYLTNQQNDLKANGVLFERLVNQIINIGAGNSIGIITCNSDHREDLYTRLLNTDDIIDEFKVQTYDSEEENSEEGMSFGEGESVISVLHSKSCKGLEFDHVFLWRLDAMDISNAQQYNLDNTLYVMICRARTDVVLFLKTGSKLLEERLKVCINKKLCEYRQL